MKIILSQNGYDGTNDYGGVSGVYPGCTPGDVACGIAGYGSELINLVDQLIHGTRTIDVVPTPTQPVVQEPPYLLYGLIVGTAIFMYVALKRRR